MERSPRGGELWASTLRTPAAPAVSVCCYGGLPHRLADFAASATHELLMRAAELPGLLFAARHLPVRLPKSRVAGEGRLSSDVCWRDCVCQCMSGTWSAKLAYGLNLRRL